MQQRRGFALLGHQWRDMPTLLYPLLLFTLLAEEVHVPSVVGFDVYCSESMQKDKQP